ncbi:hypothetical protein MJ585_01365 [Klebsiella pneumoniae]|nr:hypothetical protein MJ585_01365 [Klebsiella pneumoniae]
MKKICSKMRAVAEFSGVLGAGGDEKEHIAQHPRRASGSYSVRANVNFHGLRYVSERCELGTARKRWRRSRKRKVAF